MKRYCLKVSFAKGTKYENGWPRPLDTIADPGKGPFTIGIKGENINITYDSVTFFQIQQMDYYEDKEE